jgi:hypothetical protein
MVLLTRKKRKKKKKEAKSDNLAQTNKLFSLSLA